jgi:hypothetical protein
MATQSFVDVEDILKEWYAPAIVNQVYVKSPLWSQVKKSSKGVSGKRVYIPLRHTLSEAVGGNISGVNTLPTAGKVGYDSTYIWQKRNYGRVRVDGYGIEASKGKGGWIDLFAGETRAIAEAFAIDVDQQVMGRGTAILGHIVSVSGTAITVDDPHGIYPAESAPGYMWFRKGMLLDSFSSGSDGTSTEDDDLTITAISPSGNTITTDTTCQSSTNGDFLVRANTGSFASSVTVADAHAAGNGVIMGIDRIIDDDSTLQLADTVNFQGINATSATNVWWRAQRMRTSSTILTEMKIQEDLDQIEQNTDGDSPNLALTTYALRNKLIEIVKSDRMLQSLKLVGGWEAIKYRGGSVSLPIMVHKFCPTGYWYYINLKYLTFYTLKKLTWDSKGGGIIKPVAGSDEFEAWFKMFGNLGIDKRNAMGKSITYTIS